MRYWLILLLLIFVDCKRIGFAIDVHGMGSAASLKSALWDAYWEFVHARFAKTDEMLVYTFADDATLCLKLTSCHAPPALIGRVINELSFVEGQDSNWTSVFETVGHKDLDYLFLLARREAINLESAAREAQKLKRHGTVIFAVGVEPNVQRHQLEAVCGPCGVYRCKAGVNYALVRTYKERALQTRHSHLSLVGSVLTVDLQPLPGIVVTLKDTCTDQRTVTDAYGNYSFVGCPGSAELNLLLPVGYVTSNNTLQLVELGNETVVVPPFILDVGSIGTGPLTAGEIVAIAIMGTLLFLIFATCFYQTCNFAFFMEKEKMY